MIMTLPCHRLHKAPIFEHCKRGGGVRINFVWSQDRSAIEVVPVTRLELGGLRYGEYQPGR